MTRVVHVVVAGELGGAERMVADLAGGDGGATHAIALVSANPALRTLFVEAGARVHDRGPVADSRLARAGRYLGLTDLDWLTDVLRAERARIVHVHTFASQLLGARAARRVGARLVRSEHSTRVYQHAGWPLSRWSLRRADAIVAVSAHLAGVVRARAPEVDARLSVIPNGVDTDRFAPAPPPPPRSPCFELVALARLDPRKQLEVAIDAVAAVPRARLTIVGEGSEGPRLRAHVAARRLGERVRFVGFASDPRPHLHAADAAISSSREEGLGIALLEAMACGRPVCALPTGGVPEIVRAGETGWLASGHSAAALAACVAEAARAPARAVRLGASARAFVLARHSVHAMRAAYADVYERAQRHTSMA